MSDTGASKNVVYASAGDGYRCGCGSWVFPNRSHSCFQPNYIFPAVQNYATKEDFVRLEKQIQELQDLVRKLMIK